MLQDPLPQRPELRKIYREASVAAYAGLAVNALLALVKFSGGIFSGSFALLSDALNSFGDVLTSSIVIYGLKIAQRPPNNRHPYGHTRAEAIAACNVAVVIFLSAGGLIWEAVMRIKEVNELPPGWTLWIAGGNVAIKEALYRYKKRKWQRTGSATMLALAWDHRSDALCSLVVLFGLASIQLGGTSFGIADEVAGGIVAVAIALGALRLFLGSARELMDLQADPEFVAQVKLAALEVEGVLDVETILIRKSGLEYFVDLHIEVDADWSVARGHQTCHLVKDRLMARFKTLRDVLIHLEPAAKRNVKVDPSKLPESS